MGKGNDVEMVFSSMDADNLIQPAEPDSSMVIFENEVRNKHAVTTIHDGDAVASVTEITRTVTGTSMADSSNRAIVPAANSVRVNWEENTLTTATAPPSTEQTTPTQEVVTTFIYDATVAVAVEEEQHTSAPASLASAIETSSLEAAATMIASEPTTTTDLNPTTTSTLTDAPSTEGDTTEPPAKKPRLE